MCTAQAPDWDDAYAIARALLVRKDYTCLCGKTILARVVVFSCYGIVACACLLLVGHARRL